MDRKKSSACNVNLEKDFCKEDRTICKDCYKKKKKNNNHNTLIQNQRAQIDNVNNNIDHNTNVSAYENHRHVVIGRSNVGKTDYMFKIFEKKRQRNT